MKCLVGVCEGEKIPQWNDEGAQISDFQWSKSQYRLWKAPISMLNSRISCWGPIPVTKAFFGSLIWVVDVPHLIACVLCPSMKDHYFTDQSTPYQLRKAHFSLIKVLYVSYKRAPNSGTKFPTFHKKSPYFSYQSSRISDVMTRPRQLYGGCDIGELRYYTSKFWKLKLKIVRNVLVVHGGQLGQSTYISLSEETHFGREVRNLYTSPMINPWLWHWSHSYPQNRSDWWMYLCIPREN